MNLPGLGETSLRRIIESVRNIGTGGTNALSQGVQELAPGAALTVVADERAGEQSMPVLVPTSSGAALAGMYVADVRKGQFTVGHSVSSDLGRTFRYELRRP